MLWRTSPAATELEEVALGWLRRLIGLPDTFEGVIYDTASDRHAARAGGRATGGRAERARAGGLAGARRAALSRLLFGAGALVGRQGGHRARPRSDALRKIRRRRRLPDAADLLRGGDRARIGRPASFRSRWSPTVGTTSTTSIDPVPAIADHLRARAALAARGRGVRRRGGDAAVARARAGRRGAGRLVRRQPAQVAVHAVRSQRVLLPADGRRASGTFSLTPDYLQDARDRRRRNLMDTGMQLGRRFRALKLWMVLRSYGAQRHPRASGAAHRSWLGSSRPGSTATPTSSGWRPCLSAWCVSDGSRPAARCPTLELDAANERLVDAINRHR